MMTRMINAAAVLLFTHSALMADATDLKNETPEQIVKQAAGTIYQKLEAGRQEFKENPELLRNMVREELLPLIDQEYSARLILGKTSRGISAEQLQAFSGAMSNVLINRYADGLLEFRSNDQLEVMPLKGNNSEKLTRVRTRVNLTTGGYAPVDYAFHMTPDGWKAFDVTVEGISYVITFRNQIVPMVEADGIDKVTADILSGNVSLDEQ